MVIGRALALATHFVIACGVARTTAAQTQLEFAPYVGRYRPLNILGIGETVECAGCRDTVRFQNSVALGVRVTKWESGHLGLEASVGYAPTPLGSRRWLGTVVWQPGVYAGHALTVSAKALLRLPLPGGHGGLHVGGGLSVVGHGGDAYPAWYAGPTTFVGGIASLGGVITLTRSVGLRFDAEEFIYSAHVGPCIRESPAGEGGVCDAVGGGVGVTTSSRLQHDVVLSIGLRFALTLPSISFTDD